MGFQSLKTEGKKKSAPIYKHLTINAAFQYIFIIMTFEWKLGCVAMPLCLLFIAGGARQQVQKTVKYSKLNKFSNFKN